MSDSERRFLNRDEARERLSSLGDNDIARLISMGKYLSYGLNMSIEDLLHESIRRVLEPKGEDEETSLRQFPDDMEIVTFLYKAMQSVASGIRKRKAQSLDDNKADLDEDALGTPNSHYRDVGADMPFEAEQFMRDLQEYFKDDKDALLVLHAQIEGIDRKEICAQHGISLTTYTTALKRIRRHINPNYGKGEEKCQMRK